MTGEWLDSAVAMMKSALRLCAEMRLGGVSGGLIAAEAGQRNKNAVRYHFGDEDGLVHAIIRWRMTRLNARCAALLEAGRGRGATSSTDRIRAAVQPFAECLHGSEEDFHFLFLATDVGIGTDIRELVPIDVPWTRAFLTVDEEEVMRASSRADRAGPPVGEARARFFWTTLVSLVGAKVLAVREDSDEPTPEDVEVALEQVT